MNPKQIEDSKYVVDLQQTVFANIFWALFVFVIVMVFGLLVNKVEMLEDETNRLIGIMVCAFMFIKLVAWVGKPYLHFKEKEKKLTGGLK